MGLFSKLFGSSESKPQPLPIPEGATSREVIGIAIASVVQGAGGNCATLETGSDPIRWVQIMDSVLNCHYPHREDPEFGFPELAKHPIVAGMEGYEPGQFMTVSLNDMSDSQIADWIERYFTGVLSVDLASSRLSLRMEDI